MVLASRATDARETIGSSLKAASAVQHSVKCAFTVAVDTETDTGAEKATVVYIVTGTTGLEVDPLVALLLLLERNEGSKRAARRQSAMCD